MVLAVILIIAAALGCVGVVFAVGVGVKALAYIAALSLIFACDGGLLVFLILGPLLIGA
jgi:hypothetical protein